MFAYFCRYGNFAFNQGNIHLLNSSHYQIQDNSLTQVRITSSLHNVITGNFINGSSQEGIHIAGPGAYPSGFYPPSVGNNITYNIITHHRIGLEVEPVSYDTHVEWNLFAHNDHHAADRGENTFFEFNYWDDYEGLDLNFDGYGDTPYLVSGGGGYGVANSDPHPLMAAPGYPAVHPLERIGQYLIELAIPLLPLLIIGVIFLSCCLIYALYMRRYRI